MKSKQKELHYYIYLDKITIEGSEKSFPEELLSIKEQQKIIKAVSALPYPSNTILEEYYFNEKPTREIIQELGINKNKFYKYLDNGKYLLRQQLNGSFY